MQRGFIQTVTLKEPALSSEMPFPSFSTVFLLILSPEVWSYEAPEDKQDVFARTSCPAFLTFTNAAYLSGVTVELPCLCKPEQVQSVVWFFRKHLEHPGNTRALIDHHGNQLLDTSLVPHSGDLRSRFSIRLFSLLIFRAGPDDAGIYICGSAHKDFFYGYDLDIQEAQMLSFTSRLTSETENRNQRANLSSTLYWLFTSFRPWSVCDRCGVPGEQVRVGLCYISSHFLHVRYRRANQTVTSCGSEAVPRAFSHVKQSRVRAKLEVRSCHVTCPSQAPPSSKLLALMTFLGYSSASLPTEVPVFYLNHPEDQVLTLGCPGAQPNMAVAWDRGSNPIYRYGHSSGTNTGSTDLRLLIDTGHHLLFQPAKTQDSGIYYCWLDGRRAAEIHLLVYSHFGRSQSVLSHPDLLTAVRTLLGSYAAMTAAFFLLMLGRAVLRHRREETHVD
ncbi:Ig-like V-type domain-containing protein FAM187A [Archocentrus centrarchus]|uniref:Ig-like V-type domain-containing protein FAM187A n=1 Tax=Archocentrus centrarchus TaxID=63155 RepID=UPI0011EA3089|nr:Ig-like V-type domain-containing protein FAM187A [Archocentrus centrarchus]